MTNFWTRLAASASIIALASVGSASALDITTATVNGTGGAAAAAAPVQVADELNFATDADAVVEVVTLLEPTTGNLPSGNVLLKIDLTNAKFETALTGGNVVGIEAGGALATCDDAAVTISSGGTAGSSSVTFLVSNAQGCELGAGDGLQFTANVRPSGAGDVSISENLVTELNNQVDGPADSATLIDVVSGYTAAVTPDTTASVAELPDFLTITDPLLGTVSLGKHATADSDFEGTALDGGDDLAAVKITVNGDTTAYDTICVDLNNDLNCDAGEELTILDSVTAEKNFTADADLDALAGGARGIYVVPSGSDAIPADDYSAKVDIDFDVAATPLPFKAANETLTNPLESVTREGTQITLPWIASGTQAGVTGSNNLVRIGNVGTSDITALYAEILNGTASFVNPGVVPLIGLSIPVGGTLLLSSAILEDKLGVNWGTGDVQITVEADADSVTARRLVFNGAGFTEIESGTVDEDKQ